MPNSLVAEGMAQCGGLLVSEVYQFSELVVLAKFSKCTFDGAARPGDVLTLPRRDRASERMRRVGHRDGPRRRPAARRGGDFLRPLRRRFAPTSTGGTPAVRPGRTCCTGCALVGVFDVGVRPDGTRLRVEDYNFQLR